MASVSSLDKDLRKVRLDKFTPAAANEVRSWIENILGERLPSSDLLEGLKDGVALCKLVNLALPSPGVKFKQSAMPFVQMENISIFLRACQAPPLNLQQHDTFLTVDLYEQKDPAQVLQCLGAFSRAANSLNPANFPSVIGPKSKTAGSVSPQRTGPVTPTATRDRGISVTSNASSAYGSKPLLPHRTGDSSSGRHSPTKSPTNGATSPGATSSWSRREHEGTTSPAWNIAQYGYMGGASQGNLGISFGGRRQITSAGPKVPSLAERERSRREKEAEEERLRQEAEEEERLRRAELEAEEERARLEEERRWQQETQKLRDEERRKADEERRRWEEEERQWKADEEKRHREEAEAEARLEEERRQARSRGDDRLQGQFLSQYQAEHGKSRSRERESEYGNRIKELEKELEQARLREAEYQKERDERIPRGSSSSNNDKAKARSRSRSRPARPPSRQDSYKQGERDFLRTQWSQHQQDSAAHHDNAPGLPQHPTVSSPLNPAKSPRPLPDPTAQPKVRTHNTGGRPLPDPTTYQAPAPAAGQANRPERFLAKNPAPAPVAPQPTYSRELNNTAEQDGEDRRRVQSQAKTKAGGWASKSLLEREMELERQRQREWEEAQKETAAAVRSNDGVDGIGGGVGGRWDVGQWSGYTGGDNQSRGSQGIGAGRRQIVGPRGPRPLPGSK